MNQSKTDLLKRVNHTIDKLRPYLQSDGGDIEVLEITDENTVKVKFHGACDSCPFSEQTLKAGVEQALMKEVPEIREVISV
jgi:Fe-S cluster biogenesis protein NfuA